MTIEELRAKFNNEFGFSTPWAKKYEVDHETYANVCQDIFTNLGNKVEFDNTYQGFKYIDITLGPNNGIFFKGVELILKK